MNYLALGDSYTIGEDVALKENFPNQWAKKLGISDVTIIAKTGWTTTDLLNQISSQKVEKAYDVVSLLIGVNNQYQGKSRQLFKEELDRLIQIGLEKVKDSSNFYLLTIPDYGVTPFAHTWQAYVSTDINWYNDQIISAGKKHGVKVINITPISRLGKEKPHLLASDSLHPSAKMYALWIDDILSA